MTALEAEIGGPLWVLGESWYAFLADGRIVCTVFSEGRDRLAVVERRPAAVRAGRPSPASSTSPPTARARCSSGASPTRSASVLAADLDTGELERLSADLRRARGRGLRVRAAGARVPDERRADRARDLLSPAQPGLHRPGGRAPAAARARPRRPDRARHGHDLARDPALHQPRLRRRRRQLRRQHGLRPRVPRAAEGTVGRRRHRGRGQRRAASSPRSGEVDGARMAITGGSAGG